ncbi:ABC transporter permease [Sinosporangium album]|uniref:ABC transporter permease n=1 Tax=Sinosporangium album TaxID=504805 RepID=UPI0015A16727|nr:ABC transporter permease [Sinosporangium album]
MYAQLVDLLLIQLSNYRWAWRGTVVTGVVAPVMMLLAIGLPAKQYGTGGLAYVLVGSVVMSLMFQNQNQVAHNFAFMKAMGTLDYFATLPIHRAIVVVGTVSAFFLLSLPALGVTLLLGALFLGVPLAVDPVALLVVPLCALPLAGVGALIGLLAPGPQDVGPIALVTTMAMLFVGPVILPPDTLPDWLMAVSHVSPTNYAASAIQQVLVGPVTGRLWVDVGVLAALTAVVLWVVGRKVPWHAR